MNHILHGAHRKGHASNLQESIKHLKALDDSDRAWIIDPRHSKRLPYWDGVGFFALMFVAVATPFEVAYLEPKEPVLFVINRCIDGIFIIDIILQFFTAYPGRLTGAGAGWVTDQRTIVMHYLRGWFAIDVLSTAVSALLRANELTGSSSFGAYVSK